MSRRIRSFFGRLFLLWILLIETALAAATEKDPNGNVSAPKFVLVEEHHHVVSHIVRFAREGVLRSHARLPEEERSPEGAILIHIDSHADMGVPFGLNYLPAKKLFSSLPPEYTGEDIELLEHSEINDFLLLLGYMGIVDHFVFVEPPWSHLLKSAHHTTVDISMGVVPGGATYASIRDSPSTIFPNQELTEEAMNALQSAMDDPVEAVEIVPHKELLRHCLEESDHCILRTVRFTTLPYQGAAESIHKILNLKENKDRDIILDIDLDGFSTTSPGAISLFHSMIPDYEVLNRIFHTVHGELCDMETSYWKQLKKTSGSKSDDSAENEICDNNKQSYSHGPSFRSPLTDDGDPLPTNGNPSERSFKLIQDLWLYHKMQDDEDVVHALAEVFEYYLPAIDAWIYDDEEFVELMDQFLMQPFYVPESETIQAVLDFHFDHLFHTIFEDPSRRAPKVVNVVRSPFYTPDHHLDFIECEVFDRLLDMFVGSRLTATTSPTLYHFREVVVDRTNCLHEPNKFTHPNRYNIGTNPNIDEHVWMGTHKAYSMFFEESGGEFSHISVEFLNEHKHPLMVKELHGQTVHILPGQRLTKKVEHLTRWDIFEADNQDTILEPTKEPLLIIFMDGRKGSKQSFGSISGWIPIPHMTPVQMEVENPSDSGIIVAIKTESSGEGGSEIVEPGETLTLYTVHGKRWVIHSVVAGLEQPDPLREVIANATYGEIHSVLLFSDESEGGSEL